MAYYEFEGIVFRPRFEEFMPLVSPAENFYSVRHIPYSDFNIVDVGGKGVQKYGPIDVRIDPDDAATFEALSQEVGSLTVAGTVYANSMLVALTNKRTTPRGEWFYYSAEWMIG